VGLSQVQPGNRKAAKTEAKLTSYSIVWRQLLRTIIVFSFFGQNVYLLEKACLFLYHSIHMLLGHLSHVIFGLVDHVLCKIPKYQ
jgi:hypothetical protein